MTVNLDYAHPHCKEKALVKCQQTVKEDGSNFVFTSHVRNRKHMLATEIEDYDDPQATNLFLVVEPLFVAVSACDWYPMITFGGTPNLSL